MANLNVNFAGLDLKNPIIISSSTLTNNLQKLKNLEAAGAGAVVTKLSTIATPPPHDRQPYRSLDMGDGTWCVANGDRRLPFDEGIALIKAAKKELKIPVIASIIGKSYFVDSWIENARAFEAAGADALELDGNCQFFHTEIDGEPQFTGDCITQHPDVLTSVVRAVKSAVKIPVIMKITPFFNDMTPIALAAQYGGADAVHGLNSPGGFAGVDIYNGGKPRYVGMYGMDGRPVQDISAINGSCMSHISARHTVQMAKVLSIPLCSGGGIMNANMAIQRLMEGGRALGVCSALYLGGLKALRDMISGMETFMDECGYNSIDEIIGIALQYVTDGLKERITYKPLTAELLDPTWEGWSEVMTRVDADCLALKVENGVASIDKDICTGCGLCTYRVPSTVVRIIEK